MRTALVSIGIPLFMCGPDLLLVGRSVKAIAAAAHAARAAIGEGGKAGPRGLYEPGEDQHTEQAVKDRGEFHQSSQSSSSSPSSPLEPRRLCSNARWRHRTKPGQIRIRISARMTLP